MPRLINNANGAFARQTNKIYLAQEFLLANINNLDAVTDVFLEEYGHFVDSQLNVVDAPRDETETTTREYLYSTKLNCDRPN